MATAETKPTETKPAARPVQLPAIANPRLPYHPAIKDKFGIDQAGWRALVEAIFPNAMSIDSVIMALSYCRARNLDPFKRNVHIVPVWNKQLGRMVDTVWPGIGELRTTAFRTKEYAGRGETAYGPDITQKVGSKEITYPEWAQVTVYRVVKGDRVAFSGPRVYWIETYATVKRDDDTPNDMWANRPRGQLEKCFDSETQVLTDQGFQPFGFVTGRIMQVTDCGLEATDVAPFSRRYDGPMVTCDGNSLNFCVTPNHDMLTTRGKVEAGTVFRESNSILGYTIPLSLSGSRDDLPITDKQIVLAAAIVCDGHRSGIGFSVGVSRPRKVNELAALELHESSYVRRCAGDTAKSGNRVIQTKSDKTIFRYGRSAVGELIGDDEGHLATDIISRLSRRQARVLVDAMIRFDGSTSKTARRFYCSDQQTLGAFELAACIAGYSISNRKERQSDIGGPNWSITVSTKEQAKTFRPSASQSRLKGGLQERPNADGFIWCCTVASGVIIVRRHGLSMLCGNCAEAAALRAAFPEEIGSEYIPEEVAHGRGPVIDEVQPQAAPRRLDDLTEQLTGGSESASTADTQEQSTGTAETAQAETDQASTSSDPGELPPFDGAAAQAELDACGTFTQVADVVSKLSAAHQQDEETLSWLKDRGEMRRAAIRETRDGKKA